MAFGTYHCQSDIIGLTTVELGLIVIAKPHSPVEGCQKNVHKRMSVHPEPFTICIVITISHQLPFMRILVLSLCKFHAVNMLITEHPVPRKPSFLCTRLSPRSKVSLRERKWYHKEDLMKHSTSHVCTLWNMHVGTKACSAQGTRLGMLSCLKRSQITDLFGKAR